MQSDVESEEFLEGVEVSEQSLLKKISYAFEVENLVLVQVLCRKNDGDADEIEYVVVKAFTQDNLEL